MHGCLDFGQGKRRNAILLCCDTAASQRSRKEFWMCLSGHCRLRNDDCVPHRRSEASLTLSSNAIVKGDRQLISKAPREQIS